MKPVDTTLFLGARTSLMPAFVTHLEADINYTIVHHKSGDNQLISYTLKNVMECLEPYQNFVRISRKHVVNLNFIAKKDKESITLINGVELKPSRRKRKILTHIFN